MRGRAGRWRQTLLGLLLGLVSVAAGAGLWQAGVSLYDWTMIAREFAVADVILVGNRLVQRDEVLAIMGLPKGINIFRANLPEAARQLERDPRVQEAFLRRQFPNRLVVSLVEKRPIAIINLDRLYGIDANADLVPLPVSARLPNLPIITGFVTTSAGRLQTERVVDLTRRDLSASAAVAADIRAHQTAVQTPTVRRALDVVEAIRAISPGLLDEISEVHVEDPDDPILFTVKNGVEIRLGVGRYGEKLARLATTFQRLKRDGITTVSIDLRFDRLAIIRPLTTERPAARRS